MLRVTAIFALVFYISISIGVHVDVDTCCKSIAGLSLFSDSDDHIQALDEDCCAQFGAQSCHPITEENPEGCPSDCVYIQVLLDTPPPVFITLEIIPTPLDLELIPFAHSLSLIEDVEQASKVFDDPPSIAQEEDLYLIQGSFIAYG